MTTRPSIRSGPRIFRLGEKCVLRKGIYGLRTSPLRFFRHLNKFLLSERYGLIQCPSDPCLYHHKTKEPWLALYVDDALIKGESAAVAELEGLLNLTGVKLLLTDRC